MTPSARNLLNAESLKHRSLVSTTTSEVRS
jgi:hypothetical protein